jgi:hypothetical protein
LLDAARFILLATGRGQDLPLQRREDVLHGLSMVVGRASRRAQERRATISLAPDDQARGNMWGSK